MRKTTLMLTSALLLFSLAFVSANNATFPYTKSNNTFDLPTLNFSEDLNFTINFTFPNPDSNYTTDPKPNTTNNEPNITTFPPIIVFPPIDNSNITESNATHTLTKKELRQIKKAKRKAARAERKAIRKAKRDARKAARKARRAARRKSRAIPIN